LKLQVKGLHLRLRIGVQALQLAALGFQCLHVGIELLRPTAAFFKLPIDSIKGSGCLLQVGGKLGLPLSQSIKADPGSLLLFTQARQIPALRIVQAGILGKRRAQQWLPDAERNATTLPRFAPLNMQPQLDYRAGSSAHEPSQD